jgi:hypothetical protein
MSGVEDFPTEYTVSHAKQLSKQHRQQQQQQQQPYYEQIRDGDLFYPPGTPAVSSSHASLSVPTPAYPSRHPAVSVPAGGTDQSAELVHAQRTAVRQWAVRVKACFAIHMVR